VAVIDFQLMVFAAIDGEDAMLSTPVELEIEPGALRVLVPRSPVA
jgi:diacylglycerol kinase family enzyme